MNPRLAFVVFLAFVALLTFIAWVVNRRGTRRREEVNALRAEVVDYERLLFDIRTIANQSRDIDPSAELILMTIRDYNKEIA